MVAVALDPTSIHGLIGRARVVPVVRLPDPGLAVPLARTLVDAGLPVIEITFRAAGAAAAIRAVRQEVPAMLVGAGTVLSVEQADQAIAAGASFVVAPGTNPKVIARVLGAGLAMIPGVATPSEIEANLERGLDVMKLFPAEAVGGVAFLRAVRGPYPGVSFVPTGGVSESNLASYLAEPNVLACGGTWIAPSAVLEAGDLAAIAELARRAATAGAIRAVGVGSPPAAGGRRGA